MKMAELAYPPNLLSLSRIVLAPAIVYLLWRPESWAAPTALGLVIVAAVTDGLDGYLARRMDQVTPLGIALDPVADKIFAVVLVLGLILLRDFPVWLALLVIGRDFFILLGGLALLRLHPDLTLPSNLTGKWAFAALAVLLGAHIIRFQFSITVMTPIVSVLLIASLIVYGSVFLKARRGHAIRPFRDRATFRRTRITICYLVAAAHVWGFWNEFLR